jgi:hypothetical protein
VAHHTTVTVSERSWVQLTNASVSSITFQNVSRSTKIYITGTADATPPTLGGNPYIVYAESQGELNTSLSDLFPGISATRVWAYNPSEGEGDARVFVSHA